MDIPEPESEEVVGDAVEPPVLVRGLLLAGVDGELPPDDSERNEVLEVGRDRRAVDKGLALDLVEPGGPGRNDADGRVVDGRIPQLLAEEAGSL